MQGEIQKLSFIKIKDRRNALKFLAGTLGVCSLPMGAIAKILESSVPQWDREFDAIVVGKWLCRVCCNAKFAG